MSEAGAPVGALLVLVDPVARRLDGESVRIAKDVLSAGAAAKICLPETPEEFARALARRGHRRPVIVGDDRALVRAVGLLHRERALAAAGALSLVPVGPLSALPLAHALGVPTGTVAAARAVLDGAVRTYDLLVDDSDGVVLGGLRIPPVSAAGPGAGAGARGRRPAAARSVWSACRSLVRTLGRPPVAGSAGSGGSAGADVGAGAGRGAGAAGVAASGVSAARAAHRLRVEADGVLLADLDRSVEDVSVVGRDGLAEVVVRTGGGAAGTVTALARTVTVSGADFRYRADHAVAGPVRRRTWTLYPSAWSLTVARDPADPA
ncbi:diacylglycerol kinase [Streptomyces venezuelae]|uniref:Diacylglycerol kinase n=2 Tax=Streptomyces venezuelae TaxID=54571 RepID=A0A5P2D2G1_STRVZ|nr:diacylglycerol kinase [Streptomyces venezuelae]QES49342.1 diacylglycerol kinase [Streptomyces venezuelae]